MTYASLFAGVGGFDLALNRLGHECVYVNEWDKYAAQTYEKNFSNTGLARHETQGITGRVLEHSTDTTSEDGSRGKQHSIYKHPTVDTRSITDVSESDIPDHDILVGGFPCQAFSIAGKRAGFNDTRGTLFFDIARIIKKKRTKYLLLENVKGLLSHDSGRTFKTILSTLTELGYDIQTMVLNSKNFGVPQNRERVYIVGHLRGEPRPKVFPITSIGVGCKNPAVTLTSRGYGSQRNGTYVATDSQTVIRRLTPVECERLQGFPDNWTQGVSDTQRYKQLGNAVTVNVVEEIAKRAFRDTLDTASKKI